VPILTGKRLGPYEILSSIGAGGMGEVYRARDTRLTASLLSRFFLPIFQTNQNCGSGLTAKPRRLLYPQARQSLRSLAGPSGGGPCNVAPSPNNLEPRAISGTEGAISPFFSPDGQWLGFFADGKLKKVSASGGAALTLGDSMNPHGASWSSQGMIAFSPTVVGVLQQVSDAGGTQQPLIKKGENNHRWPEFLPGGQAVLFAGGCFQRLEDCSPRGWY
jgi:serine/threonine protein kinase